MNGFGDEGGAVDMLPSTSRGTSQPRQARGSALQLLSYSELIKAPIEPTLVAGLLGPGDLAMLFALSGSMKTFVALDLALRVATGRPWAGRSCCRGAVLYVASEGLNGLRERARAWAHQFDECEAVEAELEANFVVLGEAISFISPEFDDLLRVIGQRQFALVVVDTVARSMPGGEENSAKDMGLFVAACDRLRQQTGAAVLVIHHSTKSDPNTERGSSALRAACDVVLNCKKLQRPAGHVLVSGQKQRDGVPLPPTEFELELVDLECAASGAARRSGRLRHRPRANAEDEQSHAQETGSTDEMVLRALDEVGGDGTTHKELAAAVDRPKATVHRRIKRLTESGRIRKAKRGSRTLLFPVLGSASPSSVSIEVETSAGVRPSLNPTNLTPSRGTEPGRGATPSQSQSHALPLGGAGMGSGTPGGPTASTRTKPDRGGA